MQCEQWIIQVFYSVHRTVGEQERQHQKPYRDSQQETAGKRFSFWFDNILLGKKLSLELLRSSKLCGARLMRCCRRLDWSQNRRGAAALLDHLKIFKSKFKIIFYALYQSSRGYLYLFMTLRCLNNKTEHLKTIKNLIKNELKSMFFA